MFRAILSKMRIDESQAPMFHYYLNRHIHLDEDFHGPLSMRLLTTLCGDDPRRIEEAETAAEEALCARIRFWDGVLNAIETDCGPIGVLICYDAEFPELARHLADQGAHILFVPFCTDERQSYLRVRYCCQARAVENQFYVVMSGNVGNLPGGSNMDIQYAQSCILTPCDFPFARDGVAADTTPNVEMVAFADLHPATLRMARNSGTVQNLRDRRHDLYSIKWRGE